MELSFFKILIVVPILSVATALIFAIALYWKKSVQKTFLFWEVSSLKKASFIHIVGLGGNEDIVKIRNNTHNSEKIIGQNESQDPEMEPMNIYFMYRFINFMWKAKNDRFEPIKFSCSGK